MVHNLLCFLNDLFKSLEWKVEILEGNAKTLSKKFIGLWYNMDNCKAITIEAKEGFEFAKSKLKEFLDQIKVLQE
jgi:hypothetical protein